MASQPATLRDHIESLTWCGGDFWGANWPAGKAIPEVYHYPLSLKQSAEKAVLHAKYAVVDGVMSFVLLANFADAAHRQNIEVGVLIRKAHVSGRLTGHFDALIQERQLIRPTVEINTPDGNYTFRASHRVPRSRTKSTKGLLKLRTSEAAEVRCGESTSTVQGCYIGGYG